jgi:hypothetical protein
VASAGGGLRNSSPGVVNISFSTITDNEAGFESGEPEANRVVAKQLPSGTCP